MSTHDDDLEDIVDSDYDDNLLDNIVDNPLVERLRIQVSKGQEAVRVDKFIQNRLEGATRTKVQEAIDDGFILVNGKNTKANYKVRTNDEIVVFETRPSELFDIIAENIPLSIEYEDEDVLIVNKPVGMVVHPGCGNPNGTLVNGLAYYLQDEHSEILPRIGLVHRIDKDTSGLLVIAKNESAMQNISAQFKAHTVYRRYIALVWGDFEDDEGTIIAHVGRHQRFRKIMTAYPEGEHGKEAITHYKVLERFNYVTLLELRLETGRTHQIRVHMQYIGHPLFSDATYGGSTIVKGTIFSKYKQFVENCFKLIPRHALHAKELGFTHPKSKEYICFNSPLPNDMLSVIDKWRNYIRNLKNG